MCNKCSVIPVSEFKLVNRIIVHMSDFQDTKRPIKETKAAIERKVPKETKTPFPFNSLILLFFLIFSSCFLEKKNGYISQPQSYQNSQKPKHQ